MPIPVYVLLRSRAAMALAVGDEDAARLLRGYARTLEQDPGAATRARIAGQVAAAVRRHVGPTSETLIAQVWRDAETDLAAASAGAVRSGAGEREAAKGVRHAAEVALEAERAAHAETRAALGAERDAHEKTRKALRNAQARMREAEREARRSRHIARVLGTETKARIERLKEWRVPDGRTWYEVAVTCAERCGCPPEDVFESGRLDAVVRARHLAWVQIRRAGRYAKNLMATVWGVDSQTMRSGLEHGEAVLAELAESADQAPTREAA